MVAREDLETIRGWFQGISSETTDAMTGKSLAAAVALGNTSMQFSEASELASQYLGPSGNDEVLASFLESIKMGRTDKIQARILAGKIADETRRAAILKRFE